MQMGCNPNIKNVPRLSISTICDLLNCEQIINKMKEPKQALTKNTILFSPKVLFQTTTQPLRKVIPMKSKHKGIKIVHLNVSTLFIHSL